MKTQCIESFSEIEMMNNENSFRAAFVLWLPGPNKQTMRLTPYLQGSGQRNRTFGTWRRRATMDDVADSPLKFDGNLQLSLGLLSTSQHTLKGMS